MPLRRRHRVLAAFALAAAPLLALAACGGGDDSSLLTDTSDAGGTGGKNDGGTPGSDATVMDGGADSATPDAAPAVDASNDADAGDAADAAQNFDGGPYLVFFGQALDAGGTEGLAGFHLYDEGTLLRAGDFLADPAADEVLDVTRDPAATTWWTTSRLSGGAPAEAAYAVRTGLVSSGPTALAAAGSALAQTGFAFAIGAAGESYFGSTGLLSSVSSGGTITPIALPDPSLTVNFLAYDNAIGLVAATSPFVVDGGAAEPYVMVLAPGSSTLSLAPTSWTTVYAGDGGVDAGDAGDGGDADLDADLDGSDGDSGDAGDASHDAGDGGDAGPGEVEAGPGGGGPPSFAGITALTLAPGGHLVYGIVASGLAIVDLTASTGTVVIPDSGVVPAPGAIPVVTADGEHVVFVSDTASAVRVVLVYDTASGTFSSIAAAAGYSFSTDLALAGDGSRVFAVELANNPGASSNVVRIDPVAHAIAQTAPLALDERASLLPRFFTAQ